MNKDVFWIFCFTLSFLFVTPVHALTANISQLVLVTDVQQIAPGVLSKVITVQTQNSSGASEDVDETNDVQFTSTSPSGEFLNDKGSLVSTTMSKGTASRNFYYRDSTVGEATITVKITGRVSGKNFSTSQKIIVGGSPIAEPEDDDSTDNTNSSMGNSGSSSSSSGGGSHSSYVTTTSVNEVPPFEIGAGRARVTTTGSPISFVVQASAKSDISKARFVWTFGDGTSGDGLRIDHAYAFPGEYTVVLNAERDGKEAVSRTTVRVDEPRLTVKVVPGGVEITNKSSTEINIGDWAIANNTQIKAIPRDTIILGNRSITISEEVLNMPLEAITLVNSLKRPIVTALSSYPSLVSDSKVKEIVAISTELERIKQTLVAVGEGRLRLGTNAASIALSHNEIQNKPRATTTRSSFFDQVNHLFQSP